MLLTRHGCTSFDIQQSLFDCKELLWNVQFKCSLKGAMPFHR